ncbi:MAG: hypothetical protein KGQ49_06610, partial [Verrucomicrobia bacterium]|nr:hypothetical protein [Verrucomicrobiota bacterium]
VAELPQLNDKDFFDVVEGWVVAIGHGFSLLKTSNFKFFRLFSIELREIYYRLVYNVHYKYS